MTHSSLTAAWAQGGAAIGGWVAGGLDFSLDLYRRADYDYIGIDCQHTSYSEAQVASVLQRVAPGGPAIVVRVSKDDAALIGRVCDAGADGVIVPMVNTAQGAATAVAATRYPPSGVRSFGPSRPDLRGHTLAELADRVSVFAMIETAEGMKNVEEITAVDGLTGIYVGPADLSIGLGLDPMKAFATDQLIEPVSQIRQACENNGIILGMHQMNSATSITWIGRGVRFATLGSDVGLFQAAASAALKEVKEGTARSSQN
jgi:2-keto-3-deoxy-L-rhamnonate aldolase RhmA